MQRKREIAADECCVPACGPGCGCGPSVIAAEDLLLLPPSPERRALHPRNRLGS